MDSQHPYDPLPHQPLHPDPEVDILLANTPNAGLTEDPTVDWNTLDDFYFCFPNATELAYPDWMADPELSQLPSSHPEQDSGQMQSSQLPDQHSSTLSAQRINPSSEQRSLTNVSEWLDGAHRPPIPCSHCRRHRLQCLIIRTTPANPNPIAACSSCVALFRECSLAKGEKRFPSGFETLSPVVGHLHGVPEGADNERATMAESSVENIEMAEKGKESKQFVRKGARILREWFSQNQDSPYPTDSQKTQLSRETGFSLRRISIWFANARRRHRQKQQSSTLPSAALFRAGSPMVTSTLASMMTPMERWQASPPEDEPVPESAIQDAIASTVTRSEPSHNMFQMDESTLDLFNFDDPSSVSSLGSRTSETSDSISSAWSYQSPGEGGLPIPLHSHQRQGPHKRRPRRRKQSSEEDNIYECTFCTQSFKKRHDWARHEKSVHLPLDSWICTPDLSDLDHRFLESMASTCHFCETLLPTSTHFSEHEFHICATQPVSERSFTRKDYLWQHLRKFHGCTKLPVPELDTWRENDTVANVRSRCGFCACVLPTWSARMRHLAEHFKNGARMNQWDGDWGLDGLAMRVLRDAVLPAQRGV